VQRALLEKYLAAAERNIRLGAAHIERQRAAVAVHERLGRGTALARELLEIFEGLQIQHIARRDRLRRDLSAMSPSQSVGAQLIPLKAPADPSPRGEPPGAQGASAART
jgi:hypothetical protein